MTNDKLTEQAMDGMLSEALMDSCEAITDAGTVYSQPPVLSMQSNLWDYVWNLRGRP